MTIARSYAQAIVNLYHISISATRASPNHLAGRGGVNFRTPRTTEVEAGVKRRPPGEWVCARAEAAGDFRARALNGLRQWNVPDHGQ
jgi:hypothetical protein